MFAADTSVADIETQSHLAVNTFPDMRAWEVRILSFPPDPEAALRPNLSSPGGKMEWTLHTRPYAAG